MYWSIPPRTLSSNFQTTRAQSNRRYIYIHIYIYIYKTLKPTVKERQNREPKHNINTPLLCLTQPYQPQHQITWVLFSQPKKLVQLPIFFPQKIKIIITIMAFSQRRIVFAALLVLAILFACTTVGEMRVLMEGQGLFKELLIQSLPRGDNTPSSPNPCTNVPNQGGSGSCNWLRSHQERQTTSFEFTHGTVDREKR